MQLRGKPREKRPRLTRTSHIESDEEDLAEDETEEDGPSGTDKKCQYLLVHQNNGYWGCYDGREGTVVLFKTIQQARDYIEGLLHGRDSFRTLYGKKVGGI